MNLSDLLPSGDRVCPNRPPLPSPAPQHCFRTVVVLIMLCLCGTVLPLSAQTVLVDFGASPTANTFGLAGWNTVMHSPSNVYTADGPAGLVASTDDEYADYQGVRGSARRFNDGERILVTWYNRSQDVIRFTARISFTDTDQPDGGGMHGRWYTMRSERNYRETYTELAPGESGRTMFDIRSSGVHKTDSMYALVNVNLAIEWGQNAFKLQLVCSRIELAADVDRTPPAAPTNLRMEQRSDSKLSLRWDAPGDNVGVVDYLVYLDGRIDGYSREAAHTCTLLDEDHEYRVTITARDVMMNESAPSQALVLRTSPCAAPAACIRPTGINYLGAFRLPEQYAWGGEAVSFCTVGDGGPTGSGAADGFPGSLYVTDVNQQERGFVGELGIPAPAAPAVRDFDQLPVATELKAPVNIRPAGVQAWDFVDIWRCAMEYVAGERRLYSSWGIHYAVTGEKYANLSCTGVDNLAQAQRYGPWYAGAASQGPINAQVGDYLFSIPDVWADRYTQGRRMVVGRYRDGGLSGLGPTLYAFPLAGAVPPAANATQPVTTLLEYGSVLGSDNYHFPDAMDGYKHCDEWRGACMLRSGSQAAVAFIGRKGLGDNWYGYHGERMPHDWIIADVPYIAFDETDPDGKGWRAHRMQPMVLLYQLDDLAAVAEGRKASHEPQPYAVLRLADNVFFGREREIFSSSFDADNRLLYVTEFVRERDGMLVMHVFRVNTVATSAERIETGGAISPTLEVSPQPFDDELTLHMRLPRGGSVAVQLYDALGRVRLEIPATAREAGARQLHLATRDLPSGMYFVRLVTDAHTVSRRCLLLRR